MKVIQDVKIIDQIKLLPNVLSKEECDYLINFFKKNQSKANSESSLKYLEKEFKHEYMKDNFKCVSCMNGLDDKALQIAVKGLQTMILNYVIFQKTTFSKMLEPTFFCSSDNIRVLRYGEGEEIIDHLDMSEEIRMSCSINLNEDYEGGDFSFFHGKHKIKLKQGQGMMFPAENIWIHAVDKITKGARYSINCFLKRNGKVRIVQPKVI